MNKLTICFLVCTSFNINAQTWEDLLNETTVAPSKKTVYYNLHRGITKAAKKYHLDENFIAAILMNESAAKPCAVSSVGASGLMQLMPATAEELNVQDRFNPQSNINGGSKYLSVLLKRSKGNIYLAAALYNYGGRALYKPINKWPKETILYVGKYLPRRLNSFKKHTWQAIVPKYIRETNAHICQFG